MVLTAPPTPGQDRLDMMLIWNFSNVIMPICHYMVYGSPIASAEETKTMNLIRQTHKLSVSSMVSPSSSRYCTTLGFFASVSFFYFYKLLMATVLIQTRQHLLPELHPSLPFDGRTTPNNSNPKKNIVQQLMMPFVLR